MRFCQLFALGAMILVSCTVAATAGVTAPDQPSIGPGGNDYDHASVQRKGPYYAAGHFLDKNYQYYIYEPREPKPEAAPVILFLHAWGALNPNAYQGWIEHMTRKGSIVVWVRYDRFLSPFSSFAEHARTSWGDALGRLESHWWERHVAPERDEAGQIKTIMVGHSTGAYLAPILAAQAAAGFNIPKPLALVGIAPGSLGLVPDEDLSIVDPATRMVLVVGEDDNVACTSTATSIWERTTQIPAANRDFLVLNTDAYGDPQQIANHSYPLTTGLNDTAAVDGRDYFVTYKLSVAAAECAFDGQNCDFAFGHGSADQIGRGQWSDGTPVTPMQWLQDPPIPLDLGCGELIPPAAAPAVPLAGAPGRSSFFSGALQPSRAR